MQPRCGWALAANNNQNSTDWRTLVGGLNAQNFGEFTSFKLLSVGFLASAQSLVDTLPPAEISARLVISVIVCQFASHERRVEIFTQDAVLFLIERETAFQQLHFDDQFVEVHENHSLPCEVYYEILELFFKRAACLLPLSKPICQKYISTNFGWRQILSPKAQRSMACGAGRLLPGAREGILK